MKSPTPNLHTSLKVSFQPIAADIRQVCHRTLHHFRFHVHPSVNLFFHSLQTGVNPLQGLNTRTQTYQHPGRSRIKFQSPNSRTISNYWSFNHRPTGKSWSVPVISQCFRIRNVVKTTLTPVKRWKSGFNKVLQWENDHCLIRLKNTSLCSFMTKIKYCSLLDYKEKNFRELCWSEMLHNDFRQSHLSLPLCSSVQGREHFYFAI